MRLTARRLNRTLLRRQHLLERTTLPVADLARHLVGLQPPAGPATRSTRPLAEDEPAPVRLLGRYHDVWLSHAGRDRVTSKQGRALGSGATGGIACTVFADGYLVGLRRPDADGGVDVLETLRPLTRGEERELAAETERVRTLFSR